MSAFGAGVVAFLVLFVGQVSLAFSIYRAMGYAGENADAMLGPFIYLVYVLVVAPYISLWAAVSAGEYADDSALLSAIGVLGLIVIAIGAVVAAVYIVAFIATVIAFAYLIGLVALFAATSR
ncbi:MAG TPA: hypothetical protein VK963_02625 [Candidatus Saccharimonadales bacterium]|nr:hypothetical protein [Candidatus Saccharimonadales bacterium]